MAEGRICRLYPCNCVKDQESCRYFPFIHRLITKKPKVIKQQVNHVGIQSGLSGIIISGILVAVVATPIYAILGINGDFTIGIQGA